MQFVLVCGFWPNEAEMFLKAPCVIDVIMCEKRLICLPSIQIGNDVVMRYIKKLSIGHKSYEKFVYTPHIYKQVQFLNIVTPLMQNL